METARKNTFMCCTVLLGTVAPQGSSARSRRYSNKSSVVNSKMEKEETVKRWRKHVQEQVTKDQNGRVINHETMQEGKWGRVHHSHRRALVKGMVFCKACGKYAAVKTIALARACRGKPPPNGGISKLRRMCSGLHPELRTTEWPDGSSTAIPARVYELD